MDDIESLAPDTGKQVEQAQRLDDRFASGGGPPLRGPRPPAVASICPFFPLTFPESRRHLDWISIENLRP